MDTDDRTRLQRWWDRVGRRWLYPWGESARLRLVVRRWMSKHEDQRKQVTYLRRYNSELSMKLAVVEGRVVQMVSPAD